MFKSTLLAAGFLALWLPPDHAWAQATGSGQRPGSIDVAAIRRQAGQLADVRALLADPDPNVRTTAIREIAQSGDAVQRQVAIETGLASSEPAMQQVALRAMFTEVQKIVISLTDVDGKPLANSSPTYLLSITKFDQQSGKVDGNAWGGQLIGSVFEFAANGGEFSGHLVWSSDAGQFEGYMNVQFGRPEAQRKAVWRPR